MSKCQFSRMKIQEFMEKEVYYVEYDLSHIYSYIKTTTIFQG